MKKARPSNKIGRKRRTLGWTLLTLGLLVAGVWVSTWYFVVRYIATSVYLDAQRGCIRAEYPETPFGVLKYPRGLSAEESEVSGSVSLGDWLPVAERYMWVRSVGAGTRGRGYVVRFWPIPLLLWTPAALLLRSGILARRRAATGSCAKCGYDLAGLAVGALCPECGKGAKAVA